MPKEVMDNWWSTSGKAAEVALASYRERKVIDKQREVEVGFGEAGAVEGWEDDVNSALDAEKALEYLLSRLTPNQHEFAIMHYREGKSFIEIARALGVPESTIGGRAEMFKKRTLSPRRGLFGAVRRIWGKTD